MARRPEIRGIPRRTSILQSILRPLLISVFVFRSCHGQEAPRYTGTEFDPTVDYRTNLCERQRQLFVGNVTLANALEGLDLSVVLINSQDFVGKHFFTLDGRGVIDNSSPMLLSVLLDELAARAGFQWRNSFGTMLPLETSDGNETYTDLLEWSVNAYDLSADKWDRSLERIEREISFLEGHYDSSVILIHTVDAENTQEDLKIWGFLLPFQWNVWVMLGVTILISALVYWLLENLNGSTDERALEARPGSSVFYTALAFTGHFEFRPQTAAAMILTFSLTFVGMIVLAIYTANLASFLVARRSVIFPIETLEQATWARVPICVQDRISLNDYVSDKYPSAVLNRRPTKDDVYRALLANECEVAAVSVADFEIYERDAEFNTGCKFRWNGRVEQNIPAGFASHVDSGTLCSSLITHVLDLHLTDMRVNGFLEREWKAHLERIGTHDCLAELSPAASELNDDETFSLSIQEMSGVFIIHAALLGLAIVVALFQYFRRWSRMSRMKESQSGEPPDKEQNPPSIATGLMGADPEISNGSDDVDSYQDRDVP